MKVKKSLLLALSFKKHFSSTYEPLNLLKSKEIHKTPTLLKFALLHPNLVKHQDFKQHLKVTILNSPTRNFSIPDLILLRLLLTYSKFSNADFQWKGQIWKSMRNFQDKDLNIWDLGLIMSLYYDALRRFYEIKGRENDFFQDKKVLFTKEKEYNTALQLSLANLKEYIKVLRGKSTEGKLFYEFVLERFFEIVDNDANFNVKDRIEEILFFYKLFIGFEFKHKRFEAMMEGILKTKDLVSPHDLTEIYLIFFKKMNFSYPEIFSSLLEKVQENLEKNDKIEINLHSEPHYLFLPMPYIKRLLGNNIEISSVLERSKNLFSNKNLLDLYWILSKNFNPNFNDLLLSLEERLKVLTEHFLIRDLVILLISKIYHSLRKSNYREEIVIEDYLDILRKVAEKMEESSINKENVWEILNTKFISGNLYLVIKFLSSLGFADSVEQIFDEDILLFLGKHWFSATRNRKSSNSEKIIREHIRQIMRKLDSRKTVRFGALMAELYYCDVTIGERYVVEINGSQHYNVFFRSGHVIDEKYKYLSNFEIKRAILAEKGLTVLTIDEDSYSSLLDKKEDLQLFLEEKLTKFLKVKKS